MLERLRSSTVRVKTLNLFYRPVPICSNMTNNLIRYANNFRHHIKITLYNKNRKMNFITQRSNNTFVMQVRNIVSTFEKKDVRKDVVNEKFNDIIRHLEQNEWIQKKEMESIIELINSVYDANNYHSALLLQLCNNVMDCLPSDKIKLGQLVWTTLTMCDYTLYATHYNILLKLYVENEHDFSPMKFLMDMTNNKLQPKHITYQLCIKYCCMKGNINEALMLIEDMKKARFSVTESILNSLIMGYSQFGDIENINKILNIMKLNKLQLTNETYATVISAYAKINDVCAIEKMIQKCYSNNMYFTNKHILNVIYILVKNNNIKQIESMYQYLRKQNDLVYNEIQILLKLTNINQIHIVINVLSSIFLDNEHPKFKSVLKLIFKHIVDKTVTVNNITTLYTSLKTEKSNKKYLSMLLYCSLIKNDHLFLFLLKIYKNDFTIRPHFFWPMLIRQASNYDLQGILDILKIMINDFNVLPCVETISNYVLPFIFGDLSYVRNLLIKYQISETVINNALVLINLKRMNLYKAALYIQTFGGIYLYEIIAHDLRYALIYTSDVRNFVYITRNLTVNMDSYSTSVSNNESYKSRLVSVDEQLCDIMIDFPSCQIWMKKIIKYLVNQNIKLKLTTVRTITEFLHEHRTDDVMYELKRLSSRSI